MSTVHDKLQAIEANIVTLDVDAAPVHEHGCPATNVRQSHVLLRSSKVAILCTPLTLLRGGADVTGDTMSRFFGIHVLVLPLTLAGLLPGLREGVRAAGYNRAPNAALIQKLKAGGVVCVPTCGAVKHAVKAEQLGAYFPASGSGQVNVEFHLAA